MSHAASSGGAGMRLGVYLPALAIVFAAAPSSCSSCLKLELNFDFSGLEPMKSAFDLYAATELLMLERVVRPDDAKLLHDFGREDDSTLAQARKVVDDGARNAEADLQKKWPDAKLVARMVSLSLVIPAYGLGEDIVEEEIVHLDQEHLPEIVKSLRDMYPDIAATLPPPAKVDDEEAADAETVDTASIEIVARMRMAETARPVGEFKTDGELQRALLSEEPMTAALRIVYEVIAPAHQLRGNSRDPLLSVEVVTLRFEYDGEKWRAVSDADNDERAERGK
ncbi:MAG TPA: hypothetical protein VJ783_21520, partial [Pirellulales bacterium]|nr:hypothetical protein [Pirellulales bacterium]